MAADTASAMTATRRVGRVRQEHGGQADEDHPPERLHEG